MIWSVRVNYEILQAPTCFKCLLVRIQQQSESIDKIEMFFMTYGVLEKIIKHFEERHAEFQPLLSRSDDTLTAPFVNFCPQRNQRGKEMVLAKKISEIRSWGRKF